MKKISAEDILSYDKRFRTNLINTVTGFKSVSLIASVNTQGETNLAIFSQIIHVGANPPLLGILFRPHTVVRHTLENILSTAEFTINHISSEILRQAHHTSARWEQSEFEACGLTPDFGTAVCAPYVRESSVQIGCKLVERQDIQANGTVLIIGQIVEIRLPDNIVHDDGFIDLEMAGSLCALGLDSYHNTTRVARLSYAKPDSQPEEI